MLKKVMIFSLLITAGTPIRTTPLSWETIYKTASNNKRLLLASGCFLGSFLDEKNGAEMKNMSIFGALVHDFGKIAPQYQQISNHIFDFTASLYASYKIINALQLMPTTKKDVSTEKKLNNKKSFFEPSLAPFLNVMHTLGAFSAGYLLYKKSPLMLQKVVKVELLAANAALLLLGSSYTIKFGGLFNILAQVAHNYNYVSNSQFLMALTASSYLFLTKETIEDSESNKRLEEIKKNLAKESSEELVNLSKYVFNNRKHCYDSKMDNINKKIETLCSEFCNQILYPHLQKYCNHLTYVGLIACGAYGLRTLAKHIP